MKCTYTLPNGRPCGFPAMRDGTMCANHDPAAAERMREARRKGGAATASRGKNGARTVAPEDAPPEPKTLEDVRRWAAWATFAVATGALDARTGHEIGYLLNALRGTLEKTDLAKRFEELAATVAEAKRAGKLRAAS